MNIGICAPIDYDPTLANADYLEPTVRDFLMPSLSNEKYQSMWTRKRCFDLSVPAVNYLFPPEMKSVGPDADANVLDDYMERVLRRAGSASVGIIVYGSGPSRTVPGGFRLDQARDQLVGNLRRWAPVASRHSVTIVLEHLNRSECNIVNSVAEAAEIVSEVNHPSVRIVVDTYHMEVEQEPPSVIRRSAEFVVHVHAAEATGRNPVGTGENHRPYFRALRDIGYDGGISIEATWRSLPDQAPKAVRDLRHQYSTA